MTIKLLLLIVLITAFAFSGNALTINGITTSENGGINGYKEFVDEFNSFSEANNLNITFNLNLLSKDNSTVSVTDYENTLESLLSKKSTKYDIIFYDNIFTKKFGQHFLNLNEYLPEEHINMYRSSIAPESCIYKNNWVGLPINVDFTVLYYNNELLTKYNKNVPRTWDELYETAKEISEKENDSDIMYYNGLLEDSEFGTISLYEFIYSFRNSVESEFPKLRSPETENALEMLKKLKDEISSDTIFKSGLQYTREKISDGEFLFSKFWYSPNLIRKSRNYTILPGYNKECSGSVLGGYNIGINSYIDEEKRDGAIKVLQYVTSKEVQRKVVIESQFASALTSIYDDEFVCSVVACDIIKSVQIINRPSLINYDEWSKKFRTKIFKYIFGSERVTNILKDVDRINRGNQVSFASRKAHSEIFIYLIFFSFFLFFAY